MGNSPADLLRRARLARGYATAADAARAFGWSVPTYTSHENGIRGIRAEAAERYAKAFGLSAAALMGLGPASRSHTIQEVPVIARAEQGLWRDERLDAQSSNRTSSVPVIAGGVGGREVRFAIEVGDNSASRSLSKGDFAICIPLAERDELEVGWLVWVERVRDGLVEQSIRRVSMVSEGRVELTSHTDRAEFRETVVMPSERPGEVVIVRARIVGRYGPLETVGS